MTWTPSPEWSAGAATGTLVPVWVAPPSSSQVVRSGARARRQRDGHRRGRASRPGASSLLAPGGVVAMLSVAEVLTSSSLPALSVE